MNPPLTLAALDELIDTVDAHSYPKYMLAIPADLRKLQRQKGLPESPQGEGEDENVYHLYRIHRDGGHRRGPCLAVVSRSRSATPVRRGRVL